MGPYQKSTKCVSKTFKKSSENNEILNKRTREQMIASQFKGENVWHLYKSENDLSLQKNKEPQENINSLDEAFDAMECGDKIYIHDGRYILPYNFEFGSKNIQIEGIGKCNITLSEFDNFV